MKKNSTTNVLIRKIEKLYFRVSLIILHKRIDGYHKVAAHKEHAEDIKSPLQECVDIIVGYALDNPEIIYTIDRLKNETTADHLHHHKKPQTAGQHNTVNQEHIGELSKYFKARRDGSDLHPGINEKLQHSIWDHVHATIRCARLGDERCSKMHASIADSACKELAHYMNKEEYQAFIREVLEHLNTSNFDKPNTNT